MTKPSNTLSVVCPDCRSVLVVDAGTGAVLEHKAQPKARAFGTIEDALSALRRADEAREDKFLASVETEKRRAEGLSKQFDHLLKKTQDEDDGKRPPNPLDLD